MSRLADGTYDAVVIDAQRRDDAVALECAITSGEHRGDVVAIVTSGYGARDPLSLIGSACTLIVAGDTIRVGR